MDTDLLPEKTGLPLQIDTSIYDRLYRFTQKALQQHSTYAACTFPIDIIDPLRYLRAGWQATNYHYYWEKPTENFAIAAGGELLRLSAAGENRFRDIDCQRQAVMDDTIVFAGAPHSYAGLMFLGGFSFFDHIGNTHWHSFEAASLTVPQWLIFKDDKYAFVTLFVNIGDFEEASDLYQYIIRQLRWAEQTTEEARNLSFQDRVVPNPEKNKISLHFTPPYEHWVSSVEKAKQYISQKQFDKIVLARRLSISKIARQQATEILQNLRSQYPSCSIFLIHPPDGNSFLGATPEQLASFQNNLLFTEALAGSIERGKTHEEDQQLENDLSISSKNREEHQFVVQDMRERLRPFTDAILHDQHPQIKKLSNVQHLHTPIRAHLKADADILSIVEQLHPTPAVGGYLWEDAAPYIQELEHFERGWYAGPVGWMNASGSGEFSVAIRSGLLDEEQAHFFAGCGIVAHSNPQKEWKETNLKLKPMLSALQYD